MPKYYSFVFVIIKKFLHFLFSIIYIEEKLFISISHIHSFSNSNVTLFLILLFYWLLFYFRLLLDEKYKIKKKNRQ